MAPRREKTNVNGPVYAMGFATKNRLLIGIGGGSSKSGVPNAVAMVKLDPNSLKTEEVFSHKFPPGGDAIMSLSVHPKEKLIACGINSSPDQVKAGHNKSLKIYKVTKEGLEPHKDLPCLSSTKLEEYQKVTEWSPSGTHLLAAGTDGSIAIYEYPSWNKVLFYQPTAGGNNDAQQQQNHHGANKIYDGSWDPSGRQVATVSARKLVVYSTNDGSVVQDIPPGQMNGTVPCEYRNCRYGSHASAGYLFLFLNTAGASKQHTRAFIAKFKTADYTQIKNRAVSRSSITAAAVSQGGNVLGVAFADLSVGVFGAEKLDILYTLSNAHGFAITNIIFTRETGQSRKPILCSSSADGTVAFLAVPDKASGVSTITILLFLFLILAAVVAFTVLPAQEIEEYLAPVVKTLSELGSKVQASLPTSIPFSKKTEL